MEQKFEHSALEKDIQRLSLEIRAMKEKLPAAKMPEKEMVKSAIGNIIQTQPALPPAAEPSKILPEYLQKESPEVQLKVEELIDLALHKGIIASVNEAKKYGPLITDALHDSLTAKVYGELKERKLL